MFSVKKFLASFALVSALVPMLALQSSTAEPFPIFSKGIARGGYIYGFPILLMSETMQEATRYPYVCGLGAPVNSFKHKFETPDADFRAVVRPNVDTLYSSAFLDLSETAMVLEVPEVKDRFYLMAMLDAWTNNFAGPGTQTNGGEASTYLITGPDWSGEIPQNMEQIKAPTNLVWIIGRTQLNGPDDIAAANKVQREYKLHPLGKEEIKGNFDQCRDTKGMKTPEETVREMDGLTFFSELDQLIAKYPPPGRDREKLEDLAKIGVGPMAQERLRDLSDRNRHALHDGMEQGQKLLDTGFRLASRSSTWTPDPTRVSLGDYGDNYMVRAVVSQIGFGANRNEFATYQNTASDGRGRQLDGSEDSYTLTFAKGETPPVNAFWSVTVYDQDGFLFANPKNKFALGSYSDLETGPDGSTTLVFSNHAPEGSQANWLPIPEGPFEVTLRMYWPEDEVVTGEWKAPDLKPVD